jgi:hypothetical protein
MEFGGTTDELKNCVKEPLTGEARRRAVDCWDVEGRADGVAWAKRFRRTFSPNLRFFGWHATTVLFIGT